MPAWRPEGSRSMDDRDRIEFHLFVIALMINLIVIVILLGMIARALC